MQVSAAYIHSSSTAQIHNTNIHGSHVGIQVCSTATANVFKCQIEESRNSCFSVRGGATGRAAESKFAMSQKSHGMAVEGTGSHADASNCRFLMNAESGVYACDGATLTADLCKTEGNKFSACTVTKKAEMTLTNCECSRDTRGLVSSAGGRLTVRNGVVLNCVEEGCALWDQGVATLINCKIEKCGAQGVRAHKKGARVDMEGCIVRETRLGCVWLDDAQGRLVRCTVACSGTKHGVAVVGEAAQMDAEECLFQKHAQNGVFAWNSAQVKLRGCRSEQNGIACFNAESNARIFLGRTWDKECTWDMQGGGCVGSSGGEVVVEPMRSMSAQEQFPLV